MWVGALQVVSFPAKVMVQVVGPAHDLHCTICLGGSDLRQECWQSPEDPKALWDMSHAPCSMECGLACQSLTYRPENLDFAFPHMAAFKRPCRVIASRLSEAE